MIIHFLKIRFILKNWFFELALQATGRRGYCTGMVKDIGQPTPATHPKVLLLNFNAKFTF